MNTLTAFIKTPLPHQHWLIQALASLGIACAIVGLGAVVWHSGILVVFDFVLSRGVPVEAYWFAGGVVATMMFRK